MDFEKWLGNMLGQSEFQTRKLLEDPTALRFLITWSLFESKCFGGYAKIDILEKYAKDIISHSFNTAEISGAVSHFHRRYQNRSLFKNLMHGQPCTRMDALVQQPLATFRPPDQAFFMSLVVYRFRNNMFHGSKGIQSWLHYTAEIGLCIEAMQKFISHAESRVPTMQKEAVA